MIKSQWKTVVFWIGAVLLVVLATIFYQPAAAKTGSLLVWMNGRIYVMDIDSLILTRVGPVQAHETIAPAPGCLGQTRTPCWVAAGQNVYPVEPVFSGQPASPSLLPLGQGFGGLDSALSWSPDGIHLAYSVFQKATQQVELRIYNAATNETQTAALGVDPAIAPAWTQGCAAGLEASDCELAFKTMETGDPTGARLRLAALRPATGQQREWEISPEPIFELRWGPENELLYSRPKRYFRYVEDERPAYHIPAASKLANMSPDGRYSVYYQLFTLKGCQAAEPENGCLHLGVWLLHEGTGPHEPRLIYDIDLTEAGESSLNFVPVWSPDGRGFVFFQEGKLIYYDLQQQEATIWYKSLRGKLRSLPVFSPNEAAVAFVDDQGQGYSEYRLVVVNPRFQPIEHIVNTKTGFRVLAWLPD